MVTEGIVKIEIRVLTLSTKIAKQIVLRPAFNSANYTDWIGPDGNYAEGVNAIGWISDPKKEWGVEKLLLLQKGSQLRFDAWGNTDNMPQIFLT